MSDWKDFSSIIFGFFTVAGILFAAVKTIKELKRMKEQKAEELKNKRTQFFLTQHKRLFDDKDLFEVLDLIDRDEEKLSKRDMWNKKRKFLTFFEEIWLLQKEGYISKDATIYMFGYYAWCAHKSTNFTQDFSYTKEHWNVFFEFVETYETYRNTLPQLSVKL